MSNKTFISIKAPTSLKNRLLELSTQRKIANQENATLTELVIELIEKSLSSKEYQSKTLKPE